MQVPTLCKNPEPLTPGLSFGPERRDVVNHRHLQTRAIANHPVGVEAITSVSIRVMPYAMARISASISSKGLAWGSGGRRR